jgi:FtsP/CotA-like multicopper oxidase with cupredoxin domain
MYKYALVFTALLALQGGASDASTESTYAPQVRHYYIAAEDVNWNYAPSGNNNIKPDMDLGVWGEKLTYAKTRYIEYTDDTFTQKKPQEPYLGILGPTIRGVVGDTLKVHFRNKASQPYSVHPHGVFYTKDNEGAVYGTVRGKGDMIAPGKTYTYTWEVPERAGPGPNDGSSIVWLYHSHINSVPEMYAGLIGTLIITDPAYANPDATPNDVDKELINLFMIFNENHGDEEEEGDLMHSINGRIFGNLDGLTMKKGDRVRWHLVALGSEVDVHTPHWHGETVLHHGYRKDTVNMMAGTMTSVDMIAENPGTWLYHCHISDHITAGMIATYTIEP